MSFRHWVSAVASFLALVAGVSTGIFLGIISTPTPAWAETFTFDRVSVISWRSGGDSVLDSVTTTGWAAPMFYGTPAEGASPGPPEGRLPTGVWAPGDTVQRSLTLKNINPDFSMQLDSLEVKLTGDMGLAPFYRLVVTGPDNEALYSGQLPEYASGPVSFQHPLLLQPGAEISLTFTASLDRETDQQYQGKTVRADVLVYASPQGYANGKVTAGMLRSGSGRKTGGFVIMRGESETVPTGQLEYQDQEMGLNFHADQYEDLLISLDRTKSWFSGSGRLNGVDGYTFRARAYDFGEPGRDDEFAITIYNAAGNQVYTSGSLLGGGNIQIHK